MLNVPAEAVKDLADEMNIEMDAAIAKEILYRFGYRCGKSIVESTEIMATYDEVPQVVGEFMEQMGICKVSIKKISGNLLELEFQKITTDINFTLGAIAGTISQMLSIPFECISENGKCFAREKTITSEGAAGVFAGELEKLLENGTFYIYESSSIHKFYIGLKRFITCGYPALCVTREFPEQLKKKFGIETRYIWLTGADKKEYSYAMLPTNHAGLYSEIKDFIISNKNAVVFISGIEYIISNTSYSHALKFLQSLRDRIALSEAIGVLFLDPGALDTRDVKTFERELVLTKWFETL